MPLKTQYSLDMKGRDQRFATRLLAYQPLSSRSSRGSPRQRRLVIAAVDALLLDQPASVELHAEIVIETHGVERPGVGRGKPLHHLPIGAHRNPVRGALERHVLHPVLAAAPP